MLADHSIRVARLGIWLEAFDLRTSESRFEHGAGFGAARLRLLTRGLGCGRSRTRRQCSSRCRFRSRRRASRQRQHFSVMRLWSAIRNVPTKCRHPEPSATSTGRAGDGRRLWFCSSRARRGDARGRIDVHASRVRLASSRRLGCLWWKSTDLVVRGNRVAVKCELTSLDRPRHRRLAAVGRGSCCSSCKARSCGGEASGATILARVIAGLFSWVCHERGCWRSAPAANYLIWPDGKEESLGESGSARRTFRGPGSRREERVLDQRLVAAWCGLAGSAPPAERLGALALSPWRPARVRHDRRRNPVASQRTTRRRPRIDCRQHRGHRQRYHGLDPALRRPSERAPAFGRTARRLRGRSIQCADRRSFQAGAGFSGRISADARPGIRAGAGNRCGR